MHPRVPIYTHDEMAAAQREAHELRLKLARVQVELNNLHGERMVLATRLAVLHRRMNGRHP
ncbi:hypothetical protein [Cupriavidus sp. RAF12]|uniref:hypothetical protein n=1 Tax=Cupriavidus sp. RAF12 TaxID=3233050 RepID=UPI003F922A5E